MEMENLGFSNETKNLKNLGQDISVQAFRGICFEAFEELAVQKSEEEM